MRFCQSYEILHKTGSWHCDAWKTHVPIRAKARITSSITYPLWIVILAFLYISPLGISPIKCRYLQTQIHRCRDRRLDDRERGRDRGKCEGTRCPSHPSKMNSRKRLILWEKKPDESASSVMQSTTSASNFHISWLQTHNGKYECGEKKSDF